MNEDIEFQRKKRKELLQKTIDYKLLDELLHPDVSWLAKPSNFQINDDDGWGKMFDLPNYRDWFLALGKM